MTKDLPALTAWESEEADEPLAEVLQRCGWTKGAE